MLLYDKQRCVLCCRMLKMKKQISLIAALCVPSNIKSNRVATVMPKQWLIGRL